jgi:hypothetical protein
MSYDNLSSVSQNVLKFYHQLTGEESIPFIFNDFRFCRSRVIGLDMMENWIFTLHVCRIFTLCRTITWVVFLRMFWNFISSLLVKRGGSLSFLVGTISNVLIMEIGWTDVGSGGYILVSTSFVRFFVVVFQFPNILEKNLNKSFRKSYFLTFWWNLHWCFEMEKKSTDFKIELSI